MIITWLKVIIEVFELHFFHSSLYELQSYVVVFSGRFGVRMSDCLLLYFLVGLVEENSLMLAVCRSEQFQVQRINLPKILQGSQGPSDPPEDGWLTLRWERSIRQGQGGGAALETFSLLRLASNSILETCFLTT